MVSFSLVIMGNLLIKASLIEGFVIGNVNIVQSHDRQQHQELSRQTNLTTTSSESTFHPFVHSFPGSLFSRAKQTPTTIFRVTPKQTQSSESSLGPGSDLRVSHSKHHIELTASKTGSPPWLSSLSGK